MNNLTPHNATELKLSMQQHSRQYFGGPNCLLKYQIWPALLILWDRQSRAIPTRVADLYPQPMMSDRTRMLYIRLMVQRGFINPLLSPSDVQSELSLSDDARHHLMNGENLDVTK